MTRPKPTKFHRKISNLLIFSGIGLLTLALSVLKIKSSQESINQAPRAASQQKIILPVKIPPQGFGIGLAQSDNAIDNLITEKNSQGMNMILVNGKNTEYVKNIPLHARTYIFDSLDNAEGELDALEVEIQFAMADLSAITQENINDYTVIPSIQEMQRVVLSRILHFVIKPSQYLTENFGQDLAQYADIYILAQNDYSMEEVTQTINQLKSANPRLKVFLQVQADDQSLEMVRSLQGQINGVWIENAEVSQQDLQVFIEKLLEAIKY